MNLELVVVIMSGGFIELEWAILESPQTDKNKKKIEQEIFKRFKKNIASGLLFLGFSDEKISFSPSLEFLENFC